jgi:hypothetical protein
MNDTTRIPARGLNARQEQFFQEHGLATVLLRPAARLVRPFAWVGHLPFAQALVRLMQPRVLVELGTHTGNSFCAFCQAVVADQLDTRCYAVDTWGGDAQAGYYGDAVYAELAPYVEAAFGGFARLLRTTFDEALDQFEDGSVDLLHVDGLHSYEAVRHDFDAWARKLSPRGVVLFHDTRVFDRGFGVHRVWSELREQHAGFEFLHSHGLGVLLVGSDVAPALRTFVELATDDPDPLQAVFERAALFGLPNDAIAYQRRFGSVPYAESVNLDCELFLDRGRGFNESEKMIHALGLEEGRGVVRFDLSRFSEGLSRLRFDAGNEAIALDSVSARWRDAEGAWHALDSTGSSALSTEQNVLLFGDDPWVEFALPHPIDEVEIEVQVRAMGMALVGLLVERVKAVAGLCAELAAHRSENHGLQNELTAHRASVDCLRSELAAYRQAVAGLKAELEAHKQAESKLWSDVAAKDRDLTAKNRDLAAKDRDLTAKNRDLAVLRQAVNRPLYRALAGVKLLPGFPPNQPESD